MDIFQIHITLRYIEPPVWRRIEVPSDTKLGKLHRIIQAVMGWNDTHLHQFVAGRERYGIPDPEQPDDTKSERNVPLARVASKGDVLVYEYDFGDGWEHSIQIEQQLPAANAIHYPRCTAGARACPPEDCGGPPGYAHLIEVLHDSKHEEHEELRTWAGPDFDPEAFDLDAVNRALWRLK